MQLCKESSLELSSFVLASTCNDEEEGWPKDLPNCIALAKVEACNRFAAAADCALLATSLSRGAEAMPLTILTAA